MDELHIHLHVDRESAKQQRSIHIHLQTDQPESKSKEDPPAVSRGKKGLYKQILHGDHPLGKSGYAIAAPGALTSQGSSTVQVSSQAQGSSSVQLSAASLGSGSEVSGHATRGSDGKPTLHGDQRIRTKMYRIDIVPSADDHGQADSQQALLADSDGLMLELATGNQVDPIVWESFEPSSQRGLWRLSVRSDYGRLLGMVTHARDPRAIWILPDWTPRGALVLEPTDSMRYPRLMLTPVSAFQR